MTDNNVRSVRTNETQALELWASAEICDCLDWTRNRLKIAREHERFPKPIAVVAAGRIAVWDASAVRAWWLESGAKERTRKWRQAEAVRMFRQGHPVMEICRQLGAKWDSVNRWLVAAGEKGPKAAAD